MNLVLCSSSAWHFQFSVLANKTTERNGRLFELYWRSEEVQHRMSNGFLCLVHFSIFYILILRIESGVGWAEQMKTINSARLNELASEICKCNKNSSYLYLFIITTVDYFHDSWKKSFLAAMRLNRRLTVKLNRQRAQTRAMKCLWIKSKVAKIMMMKKFPLSPLQLSYAIHTEWFPIVNEFFSFHLTHLKIFLWALDGFSHSCIFFINLSSAISFVLSIKNKYSLSHFTLAQAVKLWSFMMRDELIKWQQQFFSWKMFKLRIFEFNYFNLDSGKSMIVGRSVYMTVARLLSPPVTF